MKYVILALLLFFTIPTALAADYTVQSESQIPSGYTPGIDGWYTQSNSPDRYKVSSSSSNLGGGTSGDASSRSESAGPNTSDSTYIFGPGFSQNQLRTGDVNMDSIPLAIAGIIQFLLGVAGTIAIVSLIYHAVQMQINSGITGDSTGVDKAKKGMYGSIIGFVVALLAWFLVLRVVELLTLAT